jgi:phosphoribosylformimino-5-aminoimidazole carboxamide ribotide isomerase
VVIFPAVDLKDGKAVRLTQGDYNRIKVYSENPEEMAKEFLKKGASHIHIVDLGGAKDGTLENFEAVKKIAAVGGMFSEVGGGIRNEERIEKYLSLGVSRVILGTVAINNFPFVEEMVKKYGDKIAVGADAKNGKLAGGGWLDVSDIDSIEFCKKCAVAGVKTVIYTDISKDGMLAGTNLEVYEKLSEIKGLNIVASGGISYLHEIKKLREMGIYGAIVGKAIYEGSLKLEDVLLEGEAK